MSSIDVSNDNDVYRLGSVVAALSPDISAGQVATAVQTWFPRASGLTYHNPTSLQPAACSFVLGDTAVVLSYGVSSFGHAASILAGLQAFVFVSGGGLAMPAFYSCALGLLGYRDLMGNGGKGTTIFAGHSLGGASAEIAALLWSSRSWRTATQVVTWGSPKPGDSVLSGRISQLQPRRVINFADPVPSLPPAPEVAPGLYLQLPPNVAAALLLFRQPTGGQCLLPNGRVVTSSEARGVSEPFTVQLLADLIGHAGYFPPPHWMTSYLIAMNRAGWAPVASIASGSPQTTVVPNASGAASGVQGFPLPAAKGASPPMAYIPPFYQARAESIGTLPKSYVVFWMGENIVLGLGKSQARTVARNLNRFLRRLLADADTIHSGPLQTALTAWLLAASNASSGITPVKTVD